MRDKVGLPTVAITAGGKMPPYAKATGGNLRARYAIVGWPASRSCVRWREYALLRQGFGAQPPRSLRERRLEVRGGIEPT